MLQQDECRVTSGTRIIVGGDTYEIGSRLGEGAAGVVYECSRVGGSPRRLAIKFLAPDPEWIGQTHLEDAAERFRREGQRGARLRHHCLIRIHSYKENDGGNDLLGASDPATPFLVMEHGGKRTLEKAIQDRSRGDGLFSVTTEKLQIALHVASAIRYLHQKKVVHRDVKPSNIFMPVDDWGGLVRLGDYGIVKWGSFNSAVATGSLTATNHEGLGTLKYMAPEQGMSAKEVGPSADIYSLGVTLFELFADRIFSNPVQSMQLMLARADTGTTQSRLASVGYRISADVDLDAADLVFEMVRRGSTQRPKAKSVVGRLEYIYERLTGEEFRAPEG